MQLTKRVGSTALAAVLTLTLCTAGGAAPAGQASTAPLIAADNAVRTVYGFEGTMDSTVYNFGKWGSPSAGFSYALADAAAEGASGEGIDGQVLKLSGSNDAEKTLMRINNYYMGGGLCNWSGALGVEMYVDASANTQAVSFMPGFMSTKYSDEAGTWCCFLPGSTAYVRADGGDWQAKTVGDDWHIVLDAGFKGWVRLSLADGCVAGLFSTNTVSVSDSLWYVRVLTFSTKGADAAVYVDSVRTVYPDLSLSAAVSAVDFEGEFAVRSQSGSQVTAVQAAAVDEGIAGEGIRGNVLKLTAPADYALTNKSCANVYNFAQIHKDWTGAYAYEMYVDASKATDAADGVQFATGLMCNKAGGAAVWANLLPGATLQIRAADGAWQDVTVAANRTITLPAGFTGWVRVPLEISSFAGGPWASTDAPTNVPSGQANVSQFTFEIAGTASPVYVDSIRTVYGGRSGDVNRDGRLSIIDARQVLRAAVGKDTMTMYSSALADRNGDGRITTTDARLLLRAVVGKA